MLRSMKSIIVAGNAACLFDDIAKAEKMYGKMPYIAVNGAAKHVPAPYLFSQHPEHYISHNWLNQQKLINDKFEIHSHAEPSDLPFVDKWWEFPKGGGSGWGARKLATFLGYDFVVLCGMPLEPGPYVGNHNLGGYMHINNVVKDLQDDIESDTDWHDNVVSMSGWTRELFGC
jgi:hypothetical protein